MFLPCDYTHYDYEDYPILVAAEWWAMDCNGRWRPLCDGCVPYFYEGVPAEMIPENWLLPGNEFPPGPVYIKSLADR